MKIILLILTISSLLLGAYTRDPITNTVYDDTTGLTWQDDSNVSINPKTWDNAIEYCKTLDFAGAQDWRLPNFNELYMIADRKTFNPAMKIDAVTGFQNIKSDIISYYYWSSTTNVKDTSVAWTVSFDYGFSNAYLKTESLYVRCVRGKQEPLLIFPALYYLLDF